MVKLTGFPPSRRLLVPHIEGTRCPKVLIMELEWLCLHLKIAVYRKGAQHYDVS